ncbi:MAG: putative Ig domain-containing protein [Verrucomicrobia bacterium]|nr:putative Ig domain-containing protein [Verrucomicrobiota bacterium]
MVVYAYTANGSRLVLRDSRTVAHSINATLPPTINGPFTLPDRAKFDVRFKGTGGHQLTASGGYPHPANSSFPLGYSWELVPSGSGFQTLPAGMSISRTGVVSGTPSARSPIPWSVQTYVFRAKATDFVGKSATANFTLVVDPADPPQNLTTCPLPEGLEIFNYNPFTLRAAKGRPPYFWSIDPPGNFPPGLKLDFRTGVISGKPTLRGTYNFTLVLRDANGLTANKTCSITIRPAPEIIVRPIFQCAQLGDYACEEIEARGGDQPYEPWDFVGDSEGFTITKVSNSKARICGNFTRTGSVTLRVRVRDQMGRTDVEPFTFEVRPRLGISTNSPLPYGIRGFPYPGKTGLPVVKIDATGGWPIYTFSPRSPLPPGLSLSPSTGAITGVPSLAGNYTFRVRVTDTCGRFFEKDFQLAIYDPITVLAQPDPCLTVNRTFSLNMTVSGGAEAFVWNDLSVSPAIADAILSIPVATNTRIARITGKPTTAGPQSFTFNVTSTPLGITETITVNYTIHPELKITSDCPQPSEATVGRPYPSQNFQAVGGTSSGNYSWNATVSVSGTMVFSSNWTASRTDSTLRFSSWIPSVPPGGFTGNSATTGIPHTISVRVTDDCGNTDTKNCTVTVYPALTCNLTNTLPCLSIRPFTLQIVADDDFALFAGNATEITRVVYQNEDGWDQQIINAASLSFNLLNDEDTYYLCAIDLGGPADISGKINGQNIADMVLSNPNRIVVSGDIKTYLSLYQTNNYSVSLQDAQNALSSISNHQWTSPLVKSNTTVLNQNPHAYSQAYGRRVGFDFPINGAVFFRVASADIGTIPDTIFATVSGGKPCYTWSISPRLPAGLNYRQSACGEQLIFFGSVTESGVFPIVATVTDQLGNTCSRNHTIRVYPRLEISTNAALQTGSVGRNQTWVFSATGGNPNPNYIWSHVTTNLPAGVSANLPPGLTFLNGILSGTPTQSGSFKFRIQVADQCGNIDFEDFTLQVSCALTLSITSTNPTSPGGSDGTATITIGGGTTPFKYELFVVGSGVPIQTVTKPQLSHTFTGLQFGVNYLAKVQSTNDSGCESEQEFSLPQSTINFDADYVLLTYEFTDGRDLDTHSELLGMDNLAGGAPRPMGYGRPGGLSQPATNPFFFWGDDNRGMGFEAVYIDLIKLRQFHPTINEIAIDCRAHWYGTSGSRPVKMVATLFKGGSMVLSGYTYTNPSAILSNTLDSFSDPIGNRYSNPERIAVFTYNLNTKVGRFLATWPIATPSNLNSLNSFSHQNAINETSQSSLVYNYVDVEIASNDIVDDLIDSLSNLRFLVYQTEVTIADYLDFLNAVGFHDDFGIYSPEMSNLGVIQSGSAGSYSYAADPDLLSYPITYVSWFDAARYANWLANGKPSGEQNSATTEDGAYSMASPEITRNAINPNTGAAPTFWLLNESEWHASAYVKSDVSGLWTYPTQSHTAPDSSGANLSNFANFGGAFGETTPVGFFDQSPGPFGTFDQAGNVREWTETLDASSETPMRIIRGGSWADPVEAMRADESHVADPTLEDDKTGFRIGGAP